MSSIVNLSSATSAIPPVNIHSHGHKKGSHLESTDGAGSDTAGSANAGSVQNLFGSLLQSLEQVIGLGSATATATAAATPVTAATASTAGASGTTSSQSASAVLQNYLNNLSHNAQANGSQSPKLAGSNVSVNA
jgi:hypothetical protein